MKKNQPSLVFCILMDLVGYITYSIPILGELGDLLWAPVSALVFFYTFGSWKGVLGGMFNFLEELLPGTDFIPSFTLMWFMQRLGAKKQASSMEISSR